MAESDTSWRPLTVVPEAAPDDSEEGAEAAENDDREEP